MAFPSVSICPQRSAYVLKEGAFRVGPGGRPDKTVQEGAKAETGA
ncbi:MAG: hypothetical protein AAF668_03960 [Pseudomonadota bacterium]